ncbi:MAG: cobalt ECF transporter T component CbiQ [Deltaproteobacteria bacterium]|nr:cobalt ECF transporter T component CbiQ [Deltaproteobacteria bacterium]
MNRSRPAKTPFCNLDPRTLLVAAMGAAVCLSSLKCAVPACAGLALAVALAAASGPPLVPLLRRLAAANFFIAFLWVTVPLTMPGETLTSLGPLAVSREGVALAASVTVKCNAIVLCFLALTANLDAPIIGCSLERLGIPAKLVFLFLFTCRYIHVIGEEWRTLQTAARLRGFLPATTAHTYRTIGNMLGLTIINSIDRSQRIYEAMLLRGFQGRYFTVAELKAAPRDCIFALLFLCALVALLYADTRMGTSHG